MSNEKPVVFCRRLGCWQSASSLDKLTCHRCKPLPDPNPIPVAEVKEQHWYDMGFLAAPIPFDGNKP